eukprot:scaffold23084_cov33-Tisochrysis_lutea.AAC.4
MGHVEVRSCKCAQPRKRGEQRKQRAPEWARCVGWSAYWCLTRRQGERSAWLGAHRPLYQCIGFGIYR